MSVLKGYKEDAWEGGGCSFQFQGGPHFKVRAQVNLQPPSGYFGVSVHQVSQEFLHQSNYSVFSSLFYCGHMLLFDWALVFIDLLGLNGHWVIIPSYTDLSTRQQGLPPYQCWWRLADTELGVLDVPLCSDSFVASMGGLKKRASKSELQFNCLYLDGLCRCNDPELSLRLTGMLYSYPALSCCQGKWLLGMLIWPGGNSTYYLEG